MNWKVILSAGALSILPLTVNAAEPFKINQRLDIENTEQQMKIARRGDRGPKMERMLQQLDLTEEQSQQIETIKQRSQTEMEGLREQLQTQRQEMQTLLASDASIDEIRAQHQETQNLHQQLGSNRFETMLEIREILTSEQRARMAELMMEFGRGRRFNS